MRCLSDGQKLGAFAYGGRCKGWSLRLQRTVQRLEPSLTADGAKAGAFAYSGRCKGWSLRLRRTEQRLEPFAYSGWGKGWSLRLQRTVQRLESSTKFVPYPVGMAKNATGYSASTERKGGTDMDVSRRDFLKKTSGSIAIGVAGFQGLVRSISAAAESSDTNHQIETREGDM